LFQLPGDNDDYDTTTYPDGIGLN